MTQLIPVKNLGIKGLMPGLAERGKIKIGAKGEKRTSGQGNEYQQPLKLDHFRITTMGRGTDGNFLRDEHLHGLLGDRPTEIPVTLLYDDINLNLQSRYACYVGKTLFCTGDGEVATQQLVPATKEHVAEFGQVPCTCYRQEPTYQGKDKCKMTGSLGVIITGAEVIGGLWRFRTTSYNSIVGLLSSMALIKRITGGALVGIPLWLTVSPKAVADPITGNQQTIYVVGLEYRGSPEALQKIGYQTMLLRVEHNMRVGEIEDEARRLITADPGSYAAPDDDAEELAEFYPEQPEQQPANAMQTAANRLGEMVETMEPAPEVVYVAPVVEQAEAPEPPAPKPKRGPKPKADKPAASPAATAVSPKPAAAADDVKLF